MTTNLLEYADKAREKIRNHALRAISVLEDQLKTAKSLARIAKLNDRIGQWKKSLELLETKNAKEETERSEND